MHRYSDGHSFGPRPRIKAVITRDIGTDAMEWLRKRDDIQLVVWPMDRVPDRQWLLENLPGAAGLLVMWTDKITTEILDIAGPGLRVVSTMSVGYEHVDIRALATRGIRFGYTPDVLTEAVADLTVMLTLMAGRNAAQTMSIVNKGEWPDYTWSPFLFCGPQLSPSAYSKKRTAGFVGFGRIARAILSRLIAFGITDCLYTTNPKKSPNPAQIAALEEEFSRSLRSIKRVNLNELARDSDVVFVLTPGGTDTRHLINEEFLRQMQKTSILVNTSRGSVVDSDALARALREGWIWGAGVDVVEGEPQITADHPLVKEPKCIVLPHIGSATLETRTDMAMLAAQNLIAGLDGDSMPAPLDLAQFK